MHSWDTVGDRKIQTDARTNFWRRCLHRHLRRRHLSTKTKCVNQPLDGGAVPNEGTAALICRGSTASSRISVSIFYVIKIIIQKLCKDNFEGKITNLGFTFKNDRFICLINFESQTTPPKLHLTIYNIYDNLNIVILNNIRQWLKKCMYSWNCVTGFLRVLFHTYWEHLAYLGCFEITFRHTTLDRTPLGKRSTRRRGLYLTTNTTSTSNKHSCPQTGFEPVIPAGERSQTPRLTPHGHCDRQSYKLWHR